MTRLGSFSLFQEKPLRELIDLAHDHGVYVSTVCLKESAFAYVSNEAAFCRADGLNTFLPIQIRMQSSTAT